MSERNENWNRDVYIQEANWITGLLSSDSLGEKNENRPNYKRDVCDLLVVSRPWIDVHKKVLITTTLPWVPEVFLACGGNFRCCPKADTSSAVGRSHERRSREKNLWHRAVLFTVPVPFSLWSQNRFNEALIVKRGEGGGGRGRGEGEGVLIPYPCKSKRRYALSLNVLRTLLLKVR